MENEILTCGACRRSTVARARGVGATDVSLTLRSGRALAIMGPSGAGDDAAQHPGRLDAPTSGEVHIAGQRSTGSIRQATVFRCRNIGFVFQFFNLLLALTATENVGLPLLPERLRRSEVRDWARAALASVGLTERAEHYPDELSGGEQRVAIARALVMRPRLVLADEPTGNLDSATGGQIVGLLRSLVVAGVGLLAVTHRRWWRACDARLRLRRNV
jgi:putative ABC transport system ATP-binding protein